MEREDVQFRVRKRGGKLGGELIAGTAPKFDWGSFKKLPNAERYAELAYKATVKEIMRQKAEGKFSDFEPDHLATMESVLLFSIACKKSDIEEWFETRDWAGAGISDREAQALRRAIISRPRDKLNKIRSLIARVADPSPDWVADYLFTKLDPDNMPPEITADML